MQEISTASTYWLSEDEQKKLISEAEAGNGDSAFRLAEFYGFSNFDEQKEFFWMLESARLNNSTAQYNVSSMLMNKGDFSEAIIWAKMAKKMGILLP